MYKLIAFDAYGTLFDVYSMGQLAEALFPGHGQALALMWRDRQIEYTRLVTMSDPDPQGSKFYLPFWELTIRSLRYVCKRMDLNLTADQEKRLMDQYGGRVPDEIDELLKFKGVGRKTANLVVTLGFGKPGICVDTHVHRICNRWGYVSTTAPDGTEIALRSETAACLHLRPASRKDIATAS